MGHITVSHLLLSIVLGQCAVAIVGDLLLAMVIVLSAILDFDFRILLGGVDAAARVSHVEEFKL